MLAVVVSFATPMVFLPSRVDETSLTTLQSAQKTASTPKPVQASEESADKAIQVSTASVAKPEASSGGSIESIVRHAAAKYGVDEAYFLNIAICESRLKPEAVNPEPVIVNGVNYGHAKGVFQFIDDTWRRMSTQAGYAGASVFDVEANINVAAWAFAHGHSGEWACK